MIRPAYGTQSGYPHKKKYKGPNCAVRACNIASARYQQQALADHPASPTGDCCVLWIGPLQPISPSRFPRAPTTASGGPRNTV
eukprot:scaffold40692_cov21-Tisochrysis_lutea.AAC.3